MLILEALILVFLPFEVATKVGDISIKIETENSAESGTDNMGSSIVKTEVTVNFEGKSCTGIDKVALGILGAKVTTRLWAE